MKRFGQWVASVVVLAAVCCGTVVAGEKSEAILVQRYEKSARGSVNGFPLLILRGTHRERGRAHGFLGAKEVVKTVDAMAVSINAAGEHGKKDMSWAKAGKLVGQFQFPERFVTELEGMLEGIEMALPKAADRTLTATGKPVTLADLKILQCGDVLELMMCSQFSAWGALTRDGSTVIGRNWDYPPFFPFDTYCIFAVEPAEKGRERTLDALWFGWLGAGFACLNEEGVYLSADNGSEVRKGAIKNPCPAALAVRMAAETASAADPLGGVRENINQKTALSILYHIVAPGRAKDDVPRAWIFEYVPGAERPFEECLRQPTADMPNALFVTNTPMIGKKDSESGCERYESILKAISSAGKDKRIDFDAARSILDAVAAAGPGLTTQYSGVVFPQQMEMRLAVSPAPGQSATKQRYAPVSWADVWALVK